MRQAKAEFYDPKMKGNEDGQGMDQLPRITSPLISKSHPPAKVSTPQVPTPNQHPTFPSNVTNQSTAQSTRKSTEQPINQSTNQPVDQSIILGRPKAFYITKKQDEDLDIAADKLNKRIGEKIHQKIDRSVVLRLLLEEVSLTNDTTIGKLANRLASRLISQLTG